MLGIAVLKLEIGRVFAPLLPCPGGGAGTLLQQVAAMVEAWSLEQPMSGDAATQDSTVCLDALMRCQPSERRPIVLFMGVAAL